LIFLRHLNENRKDLEKNVVVKTNKKYNINLHKLSKILNKKFLRNFSFFIHKTHFFFLEQIIPISMAEAIFLLSDAEKKRQQEN